MTISLKKISLVLALFIFATGPLASQDAQARKKRGRKKAAPKTQITKIAVLELNALGMSNAMRRNLELLLRNSIATLPNVQVIKPVEIQMTLSENKNKNLRDCGGGPKCAWRTGKAVSADLVVFGTISSMGDNYALNLRLFNVKRGKEARRDKATISGNRNLLIPELRMAAFRLVAPNKILGSLLVTIDLEGVKIFLDKKEVGITPLKEAIPNLKPGKHTLTLKSEGYDTLKQKVEIHAFETTRLVVDLKAR